MTFLYIFHNETKHEKIRACLIHVFENTKNTIFVYFETCSYYPDLIFFVLYASQNSKKLGTKGVLPSLFSFCFPYSFCF